ncbi:hypothetical protein COS75_02905 [Candidatus Pacearchaeota archaeon CG06_land_8_20_14_3_00_35_12]|nr:MAG: hypothetical protein COS75_02905 [Candidatus Pacearchaeota archaeon CG06_land_8_20_14_3_00_35_12]
MAVKSERKGELKKTIDSNKYAAAFAISALLLIIGILIGNYVSSSKIKTIDKMENDLKFEMMSIELQDLLYQQSPCSFSITPLEEKLEDVNSKIAFMEFHLGKKDSNLLELKKYYSLLEAKHFLLMKTRKNNCNLNYSLALFFYSNNNSFIAESERQGYVLDSLRDELSPQKFKVYPFDVDLNLDIIKDLEALNNIAEVPTTIIDGAVFIGFHSKDELRKYILS